MSYHVKVTLKGILLLVLMPFLLRPLYFHDCWFLCEKKELRASINELILIVSLKILLKIFLLCINILGLKTLLQCMEKSRKKKYIKKFSDVFKVYCIGLIMLQNKILKEVTIINQNSFTHEFRSNRVT